MTIFKDEKTHNGQQKSAQKTKDWATQTQPTING